MAEAKETEFLNSGIYTLDSTPTAIFIDPVQILNRSYTQFTVSPSLYYSRFVQSNSNEQTRVSTTQNRKKRKFRQLNEREQIADQRHKEARPLLLKAHEALQRNLHVLSFLRNLKTDASSSLSRMEDSSVSFIELGSVWQAPMYEISLHFHQKDKCLLEDGGLALVQSDEPKKVLIFNNLVVNDTCRDVEATFLDRFYIIPRESYFYMSNLEKIHSLIPAKADAGYNLIVIDPPWENGSARQKSVYPTLPNRYFLALPIKQLTHSSGALVALWVTNREKLRHFVEKELFPSWGVSYKAIIYWLKVKVDGSLISELDLLHHRPYECLLLGYSQGVKSEQLSTSKHLPENQVIISVPGHYSRKPPIGELLRDYAPGPKPVCCVELFARELLPGWTSWGNEPLLFQESRYFLSKTHLD